MRLQRLRKGGEKAAPHFSWARTGPEPNQVEGELLRGRTSTGFFLTLPFPVHVYLQDGGENANVVKQAVREGKSRESRVRKTPRDAGAANAEAKAEFIEQSGLLFEEAGHPRMAGRIFGLLIIADRSPLSSAEITRELQASKASVSTMTRSLLQAGIIERIARPGDRKDYFRVRLDSFDMMLERQMSVTAGFLKLLERGRSLASPGNRPGRECIDRLFEFYQWLTAEMPLMMDRWNRRKKAPKSS